MTRKTVKRPETSKRSQDRERPTLTSRPVVGALTILAVAVGVMVVLWLSLSSRGPGVVDTAADQARDVVRGVESTLYTNIIDRSDIPWSADEVAHLVGWGSVTLFAGFLLRTRRTLSEIAVAVFTVSFVIEIAQGALTTSRNFDVEDVSANSLGIILALMVLVAADRVFPARSVEPG